MKKLFKIEDNVSNIENIIDKVLEYQLLMI